ncbi:unnamed protein product [Heterobilharzia americana]|nr:unnamed protein product [Heterobilharzia americana]
MLDKPGHKRIWCGTEDPVQVALLLAEAEERSDDCKKDYPEVGLAGGELFSQFTTSLLLHHHSYCRMMKTSTK